MKGTQISLDFNVAGINQVIKEAGKLEQKFQSIGDSISKQSGKIDGLLTKISELNSLLNGQSELGGAKQIEQFTSSVKASLTGVIETANELNKTLANIGVPSDITGGLNNIAKTSSSVVKGIKNIEGVKSLQAVINKGTARANIEDDGELVAQINALNDMQKALGISMKGGKFTLPKVDAKNLGTLTQYANTLSQIQNSLNDRAAYATKGEGLKTIADQYAFMGKYEFQPPIREFYKTYSDFISKSNGKMPFDVFSKSLLSGNKDLFDQANNVVKEATQQATKSAEGQATAPIKVTVDKDALTNDITTAIQSKEYTINVKPQQNIADDIQKQLEGKVANINIVAGASKGVASVNSQISDFQSAYDKYVGIVNSGKGSTASLLKQYPLLSDYKKGMDVEKTKSELTGKFANQITNGSSEQIKQLSESLNALTEASGGAEKVTESFNAIRNSAQTILPPDFDEKILNLIDGLELLESHLAKSDIGSSPFIKTINELLSKGDELKALASVLADAQKGAGKSLAKEATKEEKIVRANSTDIRSILGRDISDMNMSDIEDAIIERSRLRGKEVSSREQLRNDMSLILTSDANRQNANKMYDDLAKAKAKVSNIQIDESKTKEGFDSAAEAVQKYIDALNQLQNKPTVDNLGAVLEAKPGAEKAYQQYMDIQNQYAKSTQVNKIRDSISKDINQNPKMSRDLAERYRIMQQAMESMYDKEGNKVAVTTEQYNEMQSVYSNLRAEMQATGQVGNNLFTKLGTGLGARIVQFTSFYLSFYRVVQYMRQGIETLEQFNTTLTKISYTMNVSDATLKEMGDSMQTIASDLSAPLENVEKIYTVYANMKTNPKEVEELTKYTTILSNLAGIDASAAADDVQGVIQQFGLASKDTAHIVDAFNYISANIAVDYSKGIEGLSEAVQGSGNVAKMAGLSFEQYGSIIAKVMEQTRMDGSRISNALRTIMTRLSKASTMDETVDNASLSKASEALNKIGIQVYTTSGEYREFDTIMTELAAKWDGLTDAQRENISFAIAATRQTAMLKAVLNNWTDSMDLATEATNDNGSAMRNQEKYAKSYAARLQKIKTGLQNFAVDFLDNDIFSGGIKAISGLTSALEELASALGQIGVLGGILAARSALSQKGAINPFLTYNSHAAEGERRFGVQAPFSLTTKKATEAYNAGLFQDIKKYQANMKLGEYEGPNSKYFDDAAESIKHYNAEQRIMIAQQTKAGYTTEEIAGAMRKESTGARIASKATSIFSSVLTGLITGAAIAAIGWVINQLVELSQRTETLREDVKKYNEESAQEQKSFNSGLKKISDIEGDYEHLSSGVDSLGKNVSLTTDEFSKYQDLSNQIAELIPDLITGYDEQGNAIVRLTSKYSSFTDAYKDAYYTQQRNKFFEDGGAEKVADIVENNANTYRLNTDQTDWEKATGNAAVGWVFDRVEELVDGIPYVRNTWNNSKSGTDQENLGFEKYLRYNDKDAIKAIEQDYKNGALSDYEYGILLSTDDKTDKKIFNRDDIKQVVDQSKGNIAAAATGVKNAISQILATRTDIDADTIQFLQTVVGSLNDEAVSGIKTQNEIYGFVQNIINVLGKLTPEEQKEFLSLNNLSGLSYNNAIEYENTFNKYKKAIGFKGSNTEFAEKYGISDQFSYELGLQRIYQRLRAAGMSDSDIQALLEKYGVKDLNSLQNFEKLLDSNTKTTWSNGMQTVAGAGAPVVDANAVSASVNNEFNRKARNFNFTDAWDVLGGNESGQKTQKALLDLANAGQLTIDTFKNAEGADAWIKQIGVSAEDVIPKINQLADSAKQLGALSGTVGSLREAYGEKRDEGIVGADTLSSMAETFGQLDYWKQYEQVVGTKSSSLAEVKAASDKLLTEYVSTGDYLAQLSNDNKQYYIDQLSDMGVANAVEVVNNKLQQQDNIIKDIKNSSDFGTLKENAQMAATNFTTLQNATYGELIAMANLGDISKYTQAVLAQLAMTKIDWGGLNATDAINQLVAVAKAAGVAMSSISQLSILQSKGFIDKNGNIKPGATYTVGKGRNKRTYNYQEYYDKFLSRTQLNPKELDKKIKTSIKAPKINMSTAGIDSKNGKGKSGGKDKSTKDTKQQFDWLERRVTVITSKVDLLKSKLENLFSMKKKQSNLNKQIKDQTKLIKTYTKQVDIYGKKAGAVKLSSSLKKKVRNGRLKGTKAQLIQKYGEKTANKIEKYQDWYDKKQAAKKNKQEAIAARRQLKIDKQQLYVDKYNAKAELADLQSTSGALYAKKRNKLLDQEYRYIQKSYKHQIKIAKINHDHVQVAKLLFELNNKQVEIQKKKFDNVADQYDKLVTILGYGVDKIEGEISLITARGAKVDVNKYRDEAQQHFDRQELLKLEKAELQQRIKTIKRGTAEWYDANDKLNSIDKQINEEGVATVEAMNKVREAYTDLYNAIRDQIRRAASERSFAGELLSNYSLFDYDTGVITDYGKAYSSNVVSQLYEFNNAAAVDKAELERLQSYASGKTGVTKAGQDLGYQSRKALDADIEDAYNKWQEDLKDISNLQSDIFKFAEDSLKKEEDLLKKLIDKRKEELDAAKDLHDYQKSIQEKTKNINDIQRQISAYRGDTSQEGMSKLQQLQKQLIEAQDDLQETEYDKYISDQKQMLDNLYQDYQDMLEALLSDFKNVVEDKLEEIKQYTEEGNQILVKFLSEEFGYKMQYSENGSESGVNQMSNELKKVQTQLSGTQNDSGKTPNQQQAANTAKRTVQQTKEDYWKSIYNKETVRQAGDVFAHTLVKGKKKKASDYKTAINQYLFTKNNKKVLSNSGLERMRMVLGIADNTEMLEILQWLNKNVGNIPHVKGFAKGGIVGDVVKRNGDDGFATLKVGEAVLTPLQAKQFKELVTSLPSLNGLVDGLTNVKDVGVGVQTSDTYNSTFNFEISDVQNATELLNAIKSDDKVQRALQEVTIKQLNKGSRLGVKKIG